MGVNTVNWTDLTEFLDSVDGRWDLGILTNLEPGPMRPKDLCKAINEQARDTGHALAPAVLNETLKTMRKEGLVVRHASAGFPPAVRYSLTVWAYDVMASMASMAGVDAWYVARRRYWQERARPAHLSARPAVGGPVPAHRPEPRPAMEEDPAWRPDRT
jgi:DNA-binding HxlR family transcriptional regulator